MNAIRINLFNRKQDLIWKRVNDDETLDDICERMTPADLNLTEEQHSCLNEVKKKLIFKFHNKLLNRTQKLSTIQGALNAGIFHA